MQARVSRRRVGLLLASSSVTALLVGGGAPPARAACSTSFTNTTSPGCTNAATITGITINNSTITSTITNSGTISPNGIVLTNASTVVGGIVDKADTSTINGGISIDSQSKITNAGTGIAINRGNFAGGITNSGTIAPGGQVGILIGSTSQALSFSSLTFSIPIFAGGVSNFGTLTGANFGVLVGGLVSATATANAHVIISSFSGGITNAGTISVATGGIVVGGNPAGIDQGDTATVVVSRFSGTVSNNGTISATDGIVIGGRPQGLPTIAIVTISTFMGGVVNSGTISASALGIVVGGLPGTFGTQHAAGLTISTFMGGITNSGSIRATTGIRVDSSVLTFMGAIANSGTISGSGGPAIDVSRANNAMTINQSAGLISGDIMLSSHADQLNITGGAINGNIIGAGSSNTVNFAPGAGNTFTYGPGFGVSGVNQININSGTVILDGANSATNVDVNGGTLAGAGSIDPAAVTIHAGAIFAPGTPGVPGSSMAITGNLVFQPGATYSVQLNPATASFATISGTATLAGNVAAGFAAGSYLTKQYTILQSGGLNGTFAGLISTNLPAGFSATLVYNAADVFLDLSAGSAAGSAITGLNVNQANVANAILGAFNNGAVLAPGFVGVLGLSGNNQATAFSALSGQNSAGFFQGAFQAGNSFLNLMVNPFLDGRFGSSFGPATGFASEEPPPRAAAVFASAMPVKAPPPTFDQRLSAWGGAYGGSGRVTGDPFVGSNTTTASVAAFAAGIDYRATPDTIYGFALAGGGTSWGLDAGLGGGRSDMFQAGFYGSQRWGNAYLSGALAYNFHDVTTNRTVTVGGTDMFQARFQANGVGARLESGYRYALPWMGITPYAAAQVQSIALPSYAETATSGSNQFALNFASQTATTTRTELGTWLDKSELLGNGARMTLYGRLAWAHDFVTNPALTAAFETLPGGSFTVYGAPIPHDTALTAVGAQLVLSADWSLTGTFNGDFAPGSQSYGGNGKLRYTW